MALGSHLITVRRLEKYINDVIGKKANLPNKNKTIIGNISQINSGLTDINIAAGHLQEEVDNITNGTCANLLNPTAQTQTINGVTFTNNGDGTYTVNGTASAQAYILATSSPVDLIPFRNKDIRIAGCPTGGGANKYQFNLIISDASDGDIARVIDYGGGSTYHVPSNAHHAYIVLVVQNGYTANNLLFKPMLTTDLNATYDDYVPYTGDSGRLNEDVARINSDLNGFQFHYSDVNVTSDELGRIKLTDVPQEAFMVTANALYNSINYSTSTPMRYLENGKWYCTVFNDTHLDIPQPNITLNIRVSWATIEGIS